MGICTNCGNQIYDESASVCPVCGIQIHGNRQLAQPPQYQAQQQYQPYRTAQPMPSGQVMGAPITRTHGFFGPSGGSYKKAAIFSLVGMILIILTLVTSWYSITNTNEYGDEEETTESTVNEGLFEIEMGYSYTYDGETESDKESFGWGDFEEGGEVGDLYTNLKYIMIPAMIMGIVGFGLVLVSGFSITFRKSFTTAGMSLCSFAALLALMCAIVLMIALPKAHEAVFNEDGEAEESTSGPWDSFWGSDSEGEDTEDVSSYNWHPSFGWFFALVGAVFFMLGGASVYKGGNADFMGVGMAGGTQQTRY